MTNTESRSMIILNKRNNCNNTMMFHIVDHENVGERSMPHAVAPCEKGIEDALELVAGNMDVYAEHKEELMELIPEGLPCKLTNRKTPVDYMDFSRSIVSIEAVVSQKVKNIFEGLTIQSKECSFRRISLKGFENESFYILFIPQIPFSEIVLSKCDFCSTETYDLQNTVKFSSWEEARKAFPKFQIHKIVLKKEYSNYDILQPLMCIDPFYSERILEAFEREKVVGYHIFRGWHFQNHFKPELAFDIE